MQRQADVVVVGGSAAGLAAALQLGRQRRSVIVLDSGEPRNAPASHAHGYLGREGVPPAMLIARGREEVRSYGVEVLDRRVERVDRDSEGPFRVEVVGGHVVVARRILVATGVRDQLPAIDGLADHWGRAVIHCPFCHGFEMRDRRVVQLVTHPLALHPTPLLRNLTDRLTVVLHDGIDPASAAVRALRDAGVPVHEQPARCVVTDAGRLAGVELADSTLLEADAIFVAPRFQARAEPFVPLGLEPTPHPSGLGDAIATDPAGATGVPGVYAAGNVTEPMQQLLQAAAHGGLVGARISFDLAEEDLAVGRRPRAGEEEWDHRFSGEPVFSGNPNGTLVAEVAGLTAGRALDIGAGEGADAVWLAQQGWRVTATDVSSRALDRIATVASDHEVEVTIVHADAGGLDPFGGDTFDLVSAQYAAIPRSPDGRAVQSLLDAVAPGGTLLVVHHDPMGMRRAAGDEGSMFDPDSFVSPAEVADALSGAQDFEIEAYERRPRPGGHATVEVDDIVVRARRRGPPPPASAIR